MISQVENTDCMIRMANYPDKYFDLAIVDPPYKSEFTIPANGQCAKVNKSYDLSSLNNTVPTVEYFKELKRVSKNQIIWGVNYYSYYLGAGRIIWDKDNTGVYSDAEIAYHSFSDVTKIFKYRWNGMIQQEQDKSKVEKRIHPTQKPIALYRWLLKNYASLGDKILDTHMGSQSSRIAAFDMGFDFWGYEIDKDYFEAGCKRFEVFKSQLKLQFA